MTVSTLDLALHYAAQGFTVLPVNPATKAALTKNWTNRSDKGEPGSSKDSDQIRIWWTQWPNACVGLRTGKINGFVVVDVDRHGHSDGFKTIKSFDGVDPKKTATVLSAGGGQHLYYAYAGELKSTSLGEGVDFLAEGKMVIAPGSVRANGKPYLFVNGHDLSGLAPLPGSVLAKLKRSAGQQRLDTWSAKIEATPEGERHNVVRDACWSLAHDVVSGKLDETEFRRRIADMAATCVPAYGPARRRELDRERPAQGACRQRQEGQAGRSAGLHAARLRARRRAGAELAAILSDIANVIVDYVAIDAAPGQRDRAVDRAHPLPRGDRLHAALADHLADQALRQVDPAAGDRQAGAAAAVPVRRQRRDAVPLDRRASAGAPARRGRQRRPEAQRRPAHRLQRRRLRRGA